MKKQVICTIVDLIPRRDLVKPKIELYIGPSLEDIDDYLVQVYFEDESLYRRGKPVLIDIPIDQIIFFLNDNLNEGFDDWKRFNSDPIQVYLLGTYIKGDNSNLNENLEQVLSKRL